jgi:thymidylate synthase
MISVIIASGKTIAQAYEDALIKLRLNGIEIKTQYDKPNDLPSIDATANITIDEPLTDPMIHKAFPGGIEDLREYVYELNGLKDSWVKSRSDKKDTRWEYTYHERLANWGSWTDNVLNVNEKKITRGKVNPRFGDEILSVNQIEEVIKKLTKDPSSRQAQMITWVPYLDTKVYDPPCLQRIWFRIIENKDWYLNTNISFRSNDAYNAFMMNCFGLTMFIKENILDVLQEKTKRKIIMGRINWQADSFHIYGKDRKDFEERFMKKVMSSSIENRTINFWSEDIQNYYHEVEPKILEKIMSYKD